jgi:hypothetical protein
VANKFLGGIEMKKIYVFCALVVAMAVLTSNTMFAQAHDRREAAIASSSEARSLPGGSQFTLSMPSDKAFTAVVNYLNAGGQYSVDTTNRDAGLIATTMNITGGWKQTGTRVVITIISSSATESIIRVAVTTQQRYKAAQTEPWNDPKVDAKASADLMATIQPALTSQIAKAGD